MKIKLAFGIESQQLRFGQIKNSNTEKFFKKSADSLQIWCTSLCSLLLFFLC